MLLNFYNASPKIRGPSPKKLWGHNNMQNLGRFYTESKFDRKFLRKETRYPKWERHVTETDSSRVRRKKSGELWCTIQKVEHVSLDPPKSTFSTDYISAPRRSWPLKFLHALEFEKVLLAQSANRIGGPHKNLRSTFKIGLKIPHMRAYNFGGNGRNFTKP